MLWLRALIEPRYLTPYSSAQVDDPKILAKPLDIPTNPKNIKAVIVYQKRIELLQIIKVEYSYKLIIFYL